jgi:hypothetical protein
MFQISLQEAVMRLDWFAKLTLSLIVALLGILVLRPFFQPAPVQAQAVDGRTFYVEPGYTMLRKPDGSGQMYGKMMIDMRTGDIWGFPTLVDGPYPVDPGKSEPPHSRPVYLGKFVLSDAHR